MGLKTKLAMGLVASATGAAMMAGGTFALFSATAQNTGNTFTAGTVNVDASNSGSPAFTSTSYNFANMAPGDSGSVQLTVNNTGSLGEWVQISSISTSGNLFDATNTATDTVNSMTQTANDEPLSLTANADLSSGQGGYYIPAGGSTTITVDYSFPLQADNFYQGQTGTATLNVEAVQADNNTKGGNTAIPSSAGPGVGPTAWS